MACLSSWAAELSKTGFLQIRMLVTYSPKGMTSFPAGAPWHSAISRIVLSLLHIPRSIPYSSSKLFFPLHLLSLFKICMSHSHTPYSVFLLLHAQDVHFWQGRDSTYLPQSVHALFDTLTQHLLNRLNSCLYLSWAPFPIVSFHKT